MRRVAIAMVFLLSACGGAQTAARPSPVGQTHGSLGDTWSWDGKTWQRVSASGPAPRYLASLAYDAVHHQFVLFGGQTSKGSSDETWLWDGRAWRMANPAHKPAPRREAGMAWDPLTNTVLMYGGLVIDQFEGHEVGETWSWNGTDWSEIGVGPGAPGARQGTTMISAGDRVVLFGGNNGNVNYFGDAWSAKGGVWAQVDRGPEPAGRAEAAAAWDQSTSTMFVYGGIGLNTAGGPGALGSPLSDAWSLTGGKWTQLSGGPGFLQLASAISSSGRFILLTGMACPDPTDASWAWDGRSWTRLARPGMSARWGATLAQAPDGSALLFGGSNESGC
jgi:hypothetical protein